MPFSFQKAQDLAYFEEMMDLSLISHARVFLNEKEKLFSTSLQKIMINQKALDLTEKQVKRLKEKLLEHVGTDNQKDETTAKGQAAITDGHHY